MKKYFFITIFSIFLFSTCVTDNPISQTTIINPDKYDSLIVIDVSDFIFDFYCYLYTRNDQLVFDEHYIMITKARRNLNNYYVIQVKSGYKYYMNGIIHYDTFPFEKELDLNLINETEVVTEKKGIYYLGKLSAKITNGNAICDFDKDESRYNDVLRSIINGYKNAKWIKRANELLSQKKNNEVVL